MNTNSFWNMSVEDAMGVNDHADDNQGRTMPCNSETPNPPPRAEGVYTKSIIQTPLYEDDAETLIRKYKEASK